MKTAILSFNSNPDYSYFAPLCAWAWQKMGWNVMGLYQPDDRILRNENEVFELIHRTHSFNIARVLPIEGYRSDTVSQISRLYAAYAQGLAFKGDEYLMTIDVDMIPLSDYWKFNPDEITIWGFDLTDYTEVPMCYVGMKSEKWIEVMGINIHDEHCMDRDLKSMPHAGENEPWEKRWSVDQQLLTKRLNETQFKKTYINRGKYPNGYAVGRVDRGAWTLNHKQFIDAHLFHQMYHKGREQYFNQTLDLLYHIWPDEDFGWFVSYTHKFRELTGHK